jgi:hypothetical protein
MNPSKPICPHCEEPMQRWATPVGSSWDASFLWVCFNDKCGYFVRGWAFLEERFGRRASYRHSLDPSTGATGPLPVWSQAALRDQIIPDDNGDAHGDA